MNRKHVRGFTLVELLVIVGIIGVLTSIVVASLSEAKARARDERRIQDIAALQLTLEVYYDKYHRYPEQLSGLVPEFAAVIPTDPGVGHGSYLYTGIKPVTGATGCRSYHLGTQLELPNALIGSDSDSDFNSTTNGANACGGGEPFDGGVANLYDVRPKY